MKRFLKNRLPFGESQTESILASEFVYNLFRGSGRPRTLGYTRVVTFEGKVVAKLGTRLPEDAGNDFGPYIRFDHDILSGAPTRVRKGRRGHGSRCT